MEALDGSIFNPAKTCIVPYCPKPTSVRLGEGDNPTAKGSVRRDLCKGHGQSTKKRYGDEVVVLAVWNNTKVEDYQ